MNKEQLKKEIIRYVDLISDFNALKLIYIFIKGKVD